MKAKESPVAGLRSLLTKNFGLKVVSLATAIVAFSMVRGSEDAQRSVFVDVVAILPPASSGRILVSELPDQVRVTLKGSRSRINALRPGELPPVQIDLSDTELSHYYFTDDEFQIPTGLSITQLLPVSFELDWAERGEVEVPVTATVVGSPAEGLALRRPPAVRPSAVRVVGPVEEVESLRSAETQPIDLVNLGEGRHERDVPLVRPPAHARYVNEAPIHVSIEIVRDLVERDFGGLEVTPLGGLPRSLRPQRVEVTLRGTPADLELVDPARLVPFVDLGEVDLEHGAVSVSVQVRGVPGTVDLVGTDPSEILVTP